MDSALRFATGIRTLVSQYPSKVELILSHLQNYTGDFLPDIISPCIWSGMTAPCLQAL